MEEIADGAAEAAVAAEAAASLPVGLGEVLAARDARASRQATLLADGGGPLLSLTLVSPGPAKDTPSRRFVMELAEGALAAAFADVGVAVRRRLRRDAATGPEALWSLRGDPALAKRAAMRVEEGAPWGRLVDADILVAGPGGRPTPLSRGDFGGNPRPCLACDASARDCIAARRHALPELAAEVERLLESAAGGRV